MKKNMESLKKNLMTRKFELEQEFSAIGQERFADDQIQDLADQALSSTMETIRASLQDSRMNEYKMIIQALEMIEAGTYGICIDCDQPIAEKRLDLFANATRCLSCQEQFEEKS